MIQKKPFNILSWNLKQQIIVGFILLAMLPILINLVLAITNDRKNIVRIRDQLGSLKVSQSSREVELSLSNLESILYNIYTNDEICDLATNLENNTVSIYWNGEYIDSTVCNHNYLIAGQLTNSSIPFTIGLVIAGNVYTESYSKMSIYSTRLYNRVLSEEEIKENYEMTTGYREAK